MVALGRGGGLHRDQSDVEPILDVTGNNDDRELVLFDDPRHLRNVAP